MTLPPVMDLIEQPTAPARAPWQLRRGANIAQSGVTFTVWAPDAKQVAVHVAGGAAAGIMRSPVSRESAASGR